MSSPSPTIAFQNPRKLHYSANTHTIQRALHNGSRASKELESSFRASHIGDRNITTGRQVEGVCQDFVLHGTSPATITVPCTLTDNVHKKDFFNLLETQRVEHLLVDTIASSAASDVANQYYSQVLMAHRLRRAQLEVDLYKLAIARDGLILLDGVCNFAANPIFAWRILIGNVESDEEEEEVEMVNET